MYILLADLAYSSLFSKRLSPFFKATYLETAVDI